MLHNLLSSSPAYLIDVVEPFAIWGTVGIVALLLVACLLIGIFKKEQAGSIIKKVLFGFFSRKGDFNSVTANLGRAVDECCFDCSDGVFC